MSIEQSLKTKIEASLAPTHLLVVNDSHGHSHGKGINLETHFTVVVISTKFNGVSRVDRSRMVSSLFDEERAKGLHALTQKTFTPEEWEKVKDTFEFDPPACRGGGAR